MAGTNLCGSMFEDARWSISFCCVRDGGKSVGVLVPDRRECGLVGVLVPVPATLGMDLFRLIFSSSPPVVCGELRDGKKLLLSRGVPAEPSPSMKRDTRSRPGVSTNVDPALWLRTRESRWFETTVAATDDICGGGLCEELRWRSREVIISASGGRECECAMAPLSWRELCVRSGKAWFGVAGGG